MKIVVEIVSAFVLIYDGYVIKFFLTGQDDSMSCPDPDIISAKTY